MSSLPSACPRCQAPTAFDALQGLCPKCLLGAVPGQGSKAVDLSFGEWQLEPIARGGMGDVFKARKPGLDRAVALKMVIGGEFADPAARALFRKEIKNAAQLHHPNIVPIYDVGEHDGAPWFTMRLMEGGSLAD